MRAFVLAACVLFTRLLLAQDGPPLTPIPRIEAGGHTAMIRRLAVDERTGHMVSVSDDKTARIWEITTGRLLRTLRIPIGSDNEGRLSSVAAAPGLDLVASGGWTGWEWDLSGSVYLHRLSSGELIGRLANLPGVITYLHFTRDERFLIVGTSSSLHAFRTADWTEVLRDTEYSDRIVGVDDHPRAGLAVASLDGGVRFYDWNFALRTTRTTTTGRNPVTVSFAPDGRSLAVGFIDVARVAVLDPDRGRILFESEPAPDMANLPGVSWTADGNVLLAIGDTRGPLARILRWRRNGDPLPALTVDAGRLTAITALADGRLVVASEDPAIGLLGRDGELEYWQRASQAQFRGIRTDLRLSDDGRIVYFKYGPSDAETMRFDVLGRRLETAPQAGRPPARAAEGIVVTDWQHVQVGVRRPAINGKPVPLDEFDISRAVAVSGETVLFGSDWGLSAFDRQARLLWRRPTEQTVWEVNQSTDGRVAVAALSDGTIRWYRMSDGAEIMAAFFHSNRTDWIAWIPQGYYSSSLRGDEYLGWHLNRGKEEEPDFFRAVQFERELFRRDLVEGYFVAIGALPVEAPNLLAFAPPRIKIDLPARDATAASQSVTLTVRADRAVLPMQDLVIYVNGIPITPTRERYLTENERFTFVRTLEIPLDQEANTVRVEVFNGRSMGLAEQYVRGSQRPMPRRGDLYVLSIGVNRFDDERWGDLEFAVNDAVRLQDYFRGLEGALYEKVHVRLLVDRLPSWMSAEQAAAVYGADGILPPTKKNIEEALAFVESATGDDTVIITLASHGLSDDRGNYYFVPMDGNANDGYRVLDNRDDIETLVSWQTFFDALRSAAGRRLLIVDTCEASNIEGTFDVADLAKRSAASNFALMTSAQGREASQEYVAPGAEYEEGQGLFTLGILSALRQAVDADGDGRTSLQEAFNHAFEMVQRLHDPRVGSQTPRLMAPPPLDKLVLGPNDVRLRELPLG